MDDDPRREPAATGPEPTGGPARRRRTTLVAAAGVVATLAVVGVVATSLRDGSSRDGAADEPPSPWDVPGCPAEPVDAAAQTGPDEVPAGALSVRLCGKHALSNDVPRDALVAQVDAVADAVNRLEAAAPDRQCTLDLGPGYQLVFAYPDGSSVVADGSLYGCREVVVNGVERVGADAPWERFAELLREQRASLDPPASADASRIDCATVTTPGTPGVGRPEDLTTGSFCYQLEYEQWAEVAIPSADLEVLIADVAGVDDPGCEYGGDAPLDKIVGRGAWGDRIELAPSCPSVSHLAVDWSQESLAILRRLSAEAR